MKKFFVLLLFLAVASPASPAFSMVVSSDDSYTMDNFWEKDGKYEEKLLRVGSRILYENKIDKRVPMQVKRGFNTINAFSSVNHKTVTVHQGIFPYCDNDDELAFVISHEVAHSIDAYGGVITWMGMGFNSKSYEYKADLIGIDLMVKAGYNPIAAITMMNKQFPETQYDFSLFDSHPKTSKRLMAMYKYISKKYPQYLSNNPMTKNVQYVIFTRVADREIKEFNQKEREKAIKLEQKMKRQSGGV